MFPTRPFTLSGPRVRLEPLSLEHAEGLWAVADDDVFATLPYDRPPTMQAMREWIRAALSRGALRLPFAVVVGQEVAGTTSYWYPDPVGRQVEIGSTWLGRPWWGTGINREAQRLLLEHAFTELACEKVVFRTDPENARSQQALELLGAVRDGLVRRDWPRPDGTWRDSVYYSVLREESAFI
ncbi:GNAT family N-acetyltransferase [Streptomyces jeddahensis]|uniref:Putative ribosomal N-acetyltransferase YdaF n=1 Tax=Streptomyces jeddahensis TaxID=1716141 RepID=A0A177HTY4_9ACTN|nr:GNAT family N-acetyltransferase [Streptomyces jeddahensis]OAH14150.1 putative ribosomal N-acetyltransferase YdaF [Streptomyces jeddahensis]